MSGGLGAVDKVTFSKCSIYKLATTGDGGALIFFEKVSPVHEIGGVQA